jgi:hypothetical protein
MRCLTTRLLASAVAALLLAPSTSSAKFFLITHGDTISKLGDVRPEDREQVRKDTKRNDVAVGFKYSSFGVFWIDLWTWGGEYCVYSEAGEKTYWVIPPAVAAQLLGKSEGDLGKPFNYRCPVGLLVIGGCVLVFAPMAIRAKAAENRVRRLFDDERYQKAMKVLGDRAEQRAAAMTAWAEAARQAEEKGEQPPPQPAFDNDDGGYEEAVETLVREGIPREEAEKNFQAMLNLVAQQQQQAAG